MKFSLKHFSCVKIAACHDSPEKKLFTGDVSNFLLLPKSDRID